MFSNNCLPTLKYSKKDYFCLAFSLEVEVEGSAMDIPVSRVKGHQWRISLRPPYQRSMVRWLRFLVFLMVSLFYIP